MRDIEDVVGELGLDGSEVELHGRTRAKLVGGWEARPGPESGRYVLVTGITPTAAGEGKTVTALGLGMGLRRRGRRAVVSLRQSSLGPTLGRKGGGAGGGGARVEPMEVALLGLGADQFALESANNLLAAWADGNQVTFQGGEVTWRRVLDMNDRSLRRVTVHPDARREGPGRATGFDVTAASEVTAILSLATDLGDLRRRLGRIVVGFAAGGDPVSAEDLGAAGAMAVLLRDAFAPNLLQTSEGGPVLVHGGPFANIAHGCSSVIADRLALPRAEYVVTEAGFGADLGAEKFLHLKCPVLGRGPDAVVLVATVRALEQHGGGKGVEAGSANLARHVTNVRSFGVPVVVALNRFAGDDPGAVAAVLAGAIETGAVAAVAHDAFARGGEGCVELAAAVEAACDVASDFKPLYGADDPIATKVRTLAIGLYGAADVDWEADALVGLERIDRAGFGRLPVCVAKTHLSFSHDPTLLGAPSGFVLPVRAVRLAAGAGFVTVYTGGILTMPGFGAVPRFLGLDLDESGAVTGLE